MKEYQDLANAIIVQACKDYEQECYRDDVEVFLKGEWFKALTDIDGERLLKELQKVVEEKELEKEEKKREMERIKQQRGYE